MQIIQGLATQSPRAFQTIQLLGAGLILVLLCCKNLTTAHPDILVDGLLIFLITTFLLAGIVMRIGQVQLGSVIIAANLSSLTIAIASITGGMHSFIIPWLLAIPASTVFFNKTRGIAIACGLSVIGVSGLFLSELLEVGHDHSQPILGDHSILYLVSLVTAVIYASAHAFASVRHWTMVGTQFSTNEKFYDLVSENTTQLVSVHNCEGDAEIVSAAASGLFGVAPCEISGSNFIDMIYEPDRDAFITACANAANDQVRTTLELRFKTDQSLRPSQFPAQCEFRAYSGDLFAGPVCIVLTQDITAKKAQVAVLAEAKAVAQHADKAKNQLLANVTHELRTPLNSILGFSDILGSELADTAAAGDNEALAEYVAMINESGAHLLQVVNDLLDVSTIEAGQFSLSLETLEFAELLISTCRMVEPFAQNSDINLRLETPENLGLVTVDKRAFRQIIFNLVSNAVKFSNPGTTITLGAGRGKHSMTMWVEDEGIGISKRDLERLGEPFFQADASDGRSFGGVGLGLSVVKGLVDIHGGSTSIESEPGRGTIVRVYLPLGEQGDGTRIQNYGPPDLRPKGVVSSLAQIS